MFGKTTGPDNKNALRAGHHAAAAGGLLREHARTSVRRRPAALLASVNVI